MKDHVEVPTKVYDVDGTCVHWWTWESRTICGHVHNPKVGDLFRAKMFSGKFGIFRIVEVKWQLDPSNMYFAKVEDIGYEKE